MKRSPRLLPGLVRVCSLVLIVSFALSASAQQAGTPPPYYDYPFANATTGARTLSLEDAVALSLGYAAAYRQTTFDEQVAREDVRQSRAALLPQFSVPVTQFSTTPSVVRFPDQPPIFSYVSSSAINETSAYFNTSGTLDISGGLRAGLRRSRALLAAAHAGAQTARRALVLATVDNYYGLLLAQQRRRLADEALSVAEGIAASSADLLAKGKADASEVDRARAAALARRDELEQARLAEYLAMNNLRALIGIDFDTYLTLESITRRVPGTSDFVDLGPQSFLARPELAQVDAEKLAATAEAQQARAELRPQITYSVNAGFDTADVRRLRQYSGGSVLVSVNIPIFNFGASRSRERQAELRGQALDVQRANLEAQVRSEFFGARAAMGSALQRIRYTRESVTLGQKALDSVFTNYRESHATLLEVNDAVNALAAARLAYYQAIADYYTSRYRLDVEPFAAVTPGSGTGTVTPNASGRMPTGEFSACTDGPDAAPEVGGIRLGMTESELQAMLPKLPASVPATAGLTRTGIRIADLDAGRADLPIFRGAERLDFEFYQGKLSYLRISWPATNRWNGSSEFVSNIARLLEVSGRWKAFYDWNDKQIRDAEDLRDFAIECTGYRLSTGVGLEALGGDQTPHLELEDLVVARATKK